MNHRASAAEAATTDQSGTPGERARRWASTMAGRESTGNVRQAHLGDEGVRVAVSALGREEREEHEGSALCTGATRSAGAGTRAQPEEPDPFRTCFERDRDRILHSPAFRRLAGKTQVFVFPADHQRTRLTHALEVAQVAVAISRSCRLNVALTEAIALGHDCGHGPGGHASEDAMSMFVADFDHATWGADVTAADLNLCSETLDGIRNHSWSRPAPSTPEGQVVGLADRVAYCAHDLEDAVHAGIVDLSDLPGEVVERCGAALSSQLGAFICDIVDATSRTGLVAMSSRMGDALAALRRFNHENIYLRTESVDQGRKVVAMLRALVEHYVAHPDLLPERTGVFDSDLLRRAVAYVSGMTDRFACEQATQLLGWPAERLPRGQDLASKKPA